MMQKRLVALLLITVAVLVIGLLLTQRQQATSNMEQSGSLIPELSKSLNSVTGIKISKANNELIAELNKKESGWVVSSLHDYPADFSKVREYLIKLSESKVQEAKTSKPENYARLGVEDVALEDAKGLRVELGGLSAPVKLIVGISGSGNSPGTFVRREGEAPSFLVSGDVIPEKEANNWLAREVLDLPSSEVLSVAVVAPDKSVLKIIKTDAAAPNFTVQGLPKGRTLSSEAAGNATGGALSSVSLEGVMPAAQATPDAASSWQATYLAYSGLVIDATVWDSGEKTWGKFVARIDDAQLDQWIAEEKTKADAARASAEAEVAAQLAAKPADGASPNDTVADTTPVIPEAFDVDKAKADKQKELETRVAAINARCSEWVFALPTWKTANIKQKLEDLLAPKA